MTKGKILKQDSNWNQHTGIKDGAQLILMGPVEGEELNMIIKRELKIND